MFPSSWRGNASPALVPEPHDPFVGTHWEHSSLGTADASAVQELMSPDCRSAASTNCCTGRDSKNPVCPP